MLFDIERIAVNLSTFSLIKSDLPQLSCIVGLKMEELYFMWVFESVLGKFQK